MKYLSSALLSGLIFASLTGFASEVGSTSSSSTFKLQIQLENLTSYNAVSTTPSPNVPGFVSLDSSFPNLAPANGGQPTEGQVGATVTCKSNSDQGNITFVYDLQMPSGEFLGTCTSNIALSCTSNTLTATPTGSCTGPILNSIVAPYSNPLASGAVASPSFAFFPSNSSKK
jgi:hypothetical protein